MRNGTYNVNGPGFHVQGASLVVALVAIFVLFPIALFGGAFIFMLLIGALHSIIHEVPALSFWKSAGVYVILSFIFSLLKS